MVIPFGISFVCHGEGGRGLWKWRKVRDERTLRRSPESHRKQGLGGPRSVFPGRSLRRPSEYFGGNEMISRVKEYLISSNILSLPGIITQYI